MPLHRKGSQPNKAISWEPQTPKCSQRYHFKTNFCPFGADQAVVSECGFYLWEYIAVHFKNVLAQVVPTQFLGLSQQDSLWVRLNRVELFVLLRIGECYVVWLCKPAHRPAGSTDAMNLVAVIIFTKFNCCSVIKSLKNVHCYVYRYYYCKKGLL